MIFSLMSTRKSNYFKLFYPQVIHRQIAPIISRFGGVVKSFLQFLQSFLTIQVFAEQAETRINTGDATPAERLRAGSAVPKRC